MKQIVIVCLICASIILNPLMIAENINCQYTINSEYNDSIDSIRLDLMNQKAFRIANLKKEKTSYSFNSDTIRIKLGYIFSHSVKHLMITRKSNYLVCTDIYIISKHGYQKVCSKSINLLTYISENIRDVNGDGYSDFLFHWYPESGCCLRDIYDVFLQKNDGTFVEQIKFVNPNFNSNNKTIIGLCYGYDAPLYKYKWNDFKVDTIEYIYLPGSANGNKIIRKRNLHGEEKGEILKKLPNEYIKVGFKIK